MTKQEKKINELDSRVTSLETKFEMFMQEAHDMRQEMRDRDNQRAAEIRELRQDMKDMQKSFDEKIDKLDGKIDSIGKHVQNLTVAAMVGVGTSVIAVVVMVGTMVYTILTH